MVKMTEIEIIERAIINATDVYCQMDFEDEDECSPLTPGIGLTFETENKIEKLKEIALTYDFVKSVEVKENSFGDFDFDVTYSHDLECYDSLVFEMYLYAKYDYGLEF